MRRGPLGPPRQSRPSRSSGFWPEKCSNESSSVRAECQLTCSKNERRETQLVLIARGRQNTSREDGMYHLWVDFERRSVGGGRTSARSTRTTHGLIRRRLTKCSRLSGTAFAM